MSRQEVGAKRSLDFVSPKPTRFPCRPPANMEVMPDIPEQTKLEAEVCSFLKGYSSEMDKLMKTYDADGFDAWSAAYCNADMSIIRPSGNPMTNDMFKGMLASGKIADASSEMVSLDSVKLLGCFSCWPATLPVPPGATAVATYTEHQKFSFDGNVFDDISKFSIVLEKGFGGWKMAHAHHATGQPPKA